MLDNFWDILGEFVCVCVFVIVFVFVFVFLIDFWIAFRICVVIGVSEAYEQLIDHLWSDDAETEGQADIAQFHLTRLIIRVKMSYVRIRIWWIFGYTSHSN